MTVRRIDDLIARGQSLVSCLSRGDCPRFLAFCPNGAQGDSPGQRPVGWNVAIESRPEGAELNGADINGSTYPGRRFALPWAISFCPFGAGKQKNPIARGLSPVALRPAPAATRNGILEGSKPLAGGKRSATTGGCWREAKEAFTTGQNPQNVRFRDRIGRRRRKQGKHSATLLCGDCPRLLVPGCLFKM